jgi:ethanolamine phosphate transferase 2 subunit G
MSSTASNYDVGKLQLGVFITTLATLAIAYVATSVILPASRTLVGAFALCLAYGGIMFASSYVEEEHHFWYWSASAWLVLLWAKWYGCESSYTSKI